MKIVVKKSLCDAYFAEKGIKDTSKLVKKQITNKNGKRTTVWVRPDDLEKTRNGENTTHEDLEKVKRIAVIKAKTQRGDNIVFEKEKREFTGMVVAKGDDGVTAQRKAVAYQVPYENIKRNLTKDGIEIPEKFNAANYCNKYMDFEISNLEKAEKGSGVKYFLEKYLPGKDGVEMARKCNEFEKRVREQIAKEGETVDLYRISGEGANAVYSDERESTVHKKIFEFYFSPEKIAKAQPKHGEKPKFVILGGRAGAGKSWFAEQEGGLYTEAFKNGEYIKLDADEIKSFLPEYEGWNAQTVHEESSDLNKKLTAYAMKLKCNIIIDGTMANPKKAVKQVQEFKAAGYATSCDYMFTPMQESMKRACNRFKTRKGDYSGRFVPLGIMTGMTQNEDAFEAVKGIVDRYSFRDNFNQTNGHATLITQKGNY